MTLALSPREQEIVEILLTGASDKEIAAQLKLTAWTVRAYLKNVRYKLGVHSRTAIMAHIFNERYAALELELAWFRRTYP